MNTALPFYRKTLNDQLVERIEKNPKYSLRAFAKALHIESGALSKIMSGKRFLSEQKAYQLINKLDLNHEEQEAFLFSLAQSRIDAGLKRMSPSQRSRVVKASETPTTRELTGDIFRIVSDWYHYAILQLVRVSNFKNDVSWISKRLNITEAEVVGAIDRLITLELLEDHNGQLINTSFYINTANHGVSTSALRRRQKQIIEKSLNSLENDSIRIRNHSARTVAINLKNIAKAKIKIEKFMVELCDELADGDREEVYELSIQLFPLTQIESKEN